MRARQGVGPKLGSGFIRHTIWDSHLHQKNPGDLSTFHIQCSDM